jgi:hypothetical protein
MAGIAQGERPRGREQIAFAVILIIVGLVGLASQVVEPPPALGGWVVLLIGLAFAGAFAYTQKYPFLVPAGILAGLGTGILLSENLAVTGEQSGGLVVLGLGVGFLSIWAVGALVRAAGNHLWPTVPGGILTVVGVALLIGGQAVDLLDYWGVGAVAVGLVLLVRAWLQTPRSDASR